METINVSTLKAQVSKILREVKNGVTFTIVERQTPVAELTRIDKEDELAIASIAHGKFSKPAGVFVTTKKDPLHVLLEDRARR